MEIIFLNDSEIDFTCPYCDKIGKIKLKQAINEKKYVCNHCENVTELDIDELEASMKEIDESIKNLENTVDEINKSLKF